jgi:hypothetical protein
MYDFMGTHFQSSEDAAVIMKEIAKYKQFTYDYKAGVRIFHQGNHYAADRVNVVQGMREETYLKHKAALDGYDRAKTAYDSAKKAFDKAVDARKEIVLEVNDQVDDCRDVLREERLINETLDRYVTLAKGDTKIAYGFLVAAKPRIDLNHDHKDLWSQLERTHNPPEAGPMDEAA